jgi:class 3 adenylate cyclase/tetratricopeptide (TPR) repeat protein
MLTCSACGTENEAGRKFCKECAARLAVTCPSCGSANSPDAKFCGECATPLAAGASAATPTARREPSALREAGSPPAGAAGSERRLVSVLFADLVGFTPFAEARDAEDVRETLSRYFELASGVVTRYGGVVEKFIGDAVMAVWGAPVAREDDAERAVRAGLDLVEAVRSLGTGIAARAAVLTGEAATTIGATNQGMVAGDLVNTAARLQAAAEPGTVLVGEATMRATEQSIAFERADDQTLKGKSAPVTAYRALRVVSELGGRGRAETLEAPFVGRDDELRLLKELLDATGRDRRARLITVTGPAGIGKSRLIWELEKYVDGVVESIYWHRGRSPSYGQGITFWALGEIVRRRAGAAESDDEPTTRAKIAATVAEYVPDPDDRVWVEPALLALLGLDPPPAGGREVLFAAWRIFFERIAERGTTVLLFEDLQWADTGLLDFIDHMLEWSRGRPIVVIGLTRPDLFDRRPDWGTAHRNATTLALEPLSATAMREMLDALVPGLPEAAAQQILARADGMPLYAVELLRALIADGHLERAGEAYRVVGEIGALAVPETLRSLIGARLDSLVPADRTLLQEAAVLGQSFVASSLAAVSGREVDELEAALRGLVRRELLTVQLDPRSPERGQYAFVQSLTREVAYGTLGRRERRSRHLAAARHFEAMGDDELASALAAHYVAAYEASSEGAEAQAVAAQARLALKAAAGRATGLGAHDQAIEYLDRALMLTDDPADVAEMALNAAKSADLAARYSDGRAYAERAVQAYTDAGNPSGAGLASAELSHCLINDAHPAEATQVLERALAALDADHDPGVEAALLAALSRCLMRSGDFGRTLEVADRALTIAEPADLEQFVAEAMANKAAVLGYLGRRRESVALFETAIRLAEHNGWIDLELRARHNLSGIIWFDDPMRSRDVLTAGTELAERVGSRNHLFWLLASLATQPLDFGVDPDPVLARLERALAMRPPVSDRLRLQLAKDTIRMARGQLGDAEFREVQEIAAQIDDPGYVFVVHLFVGQRALLAGRHVEALAAFREAATVHHAEAVFAHYWAAVAALWGRDLDAAEGAVAAMNVDKAIGGPTVVAERLPLAAGILALKGRRNQAIRGYLEAIRRLDDLGLHFISARAAVDAAILLPHAPELRPATEAAREVFKGWGAQAYLDILEQAELQARPVANPEHAGVVTPA